jgi:hypothetical protein
MGNRSVVISTLQILVDSVSPEMFEGYKKTVNEIWPSTVHQFHFPKGLSAPQKRTPSVKGFSSSAAPAPPLPIAASPRRKPVITERPPIEEPRMEVPPPPEAPQKSEIRSRKKRGHFPWGAIFMIVLLLLSAAVIWWIIKF